MQFTPSVKAFRVLRDHPDAVVPRRAEPGAAGYDLVSIEDVCINPQSRAVVDTGIIVECPNDCYVRIAPRSGLAVKSGIDVLAGVVDSSYRGRIKVVLLNTDKNFPYLVEKGAKIAQIIFERIYTPVIEEVNTADKLTGTERGIGGFGSTGTHVA